MQPKEYLLRANSFSLPKMLWLLVVLLLTTIVVTEWLLRLQFPHQDLMFINMLMFLSILDALCILSLAIITERVTISGNNLSQKVLLSRRSVSFDNSVSIAPHEPSTKNGKPQAYQLVLKNATGTAIILDASKFPRKDSLTIADFVGKKLVMASVADDAVAEVQRIITLWKHPQPSPLKTACKYIFLLVMLGILGMNVAVVVPNALNIYTNCNQIRANSLTANATVKSISLKYQKQGFHRSNTYVLPE